MKIWKFIVGGGLVFLTGRYLFNLNRAEKKAVVQIGAEIKKANLEGVVVVLKYNIKNPSGSRMEMTIPLITLSHDKNVLASSSMKMVEIPEDVKSAKGRIKIEPFNETGIITTTLVIPYLSLISAGNNLFARLKNKLDPSAEQEKVKFEVNTAATIFTGAVSFPYDDQTIVEV